MNRGSRGADRGGTGVAGRWTSVVLGGTVADGSRLRWPGAVGAFALLGEVLWTGIVVAVAGLPLVTLPAAVAAGAAHLRRHLRGEGASFGQFMADLRRAVPGGAVVGAAALILVVVVAADLVIVLGGGVPGAAPVGVVVALVGVAGIGLVATAAASWRPGAPWRRLLRDAAVASWRDPRGVALTAVAFGLTGVAVWQFLPLVIPALGVLVFALVVVAERRGA